MARGEGRAGYIKREKGAVFSGGGWHFLGGRFRRADSCCVNFLSLFLALPGWIGGVGGKAHPEAFEAPLPGAERKA